eukprot:1661632-Amphidinium_carterae.2
MRHGLISTWIGPHSPQSNGRAEVVIRNLTGSRSLCSTRLIHDDNEALRVTRLRSRGKSVGKMAVIVSEAPFSLTDFLYLSHDVLSSLQMGKDEFTTFLSLDRTLQHAIEQNTRIEFR